MSGYDARALATRDATPAEQRLVLARRPRHWELQKVAARQHAREQHSSRVAVQSRGICRIWKKNERMNIEGRYQ